MKRSIFLMMLISGFASINFFSQVTDPIEQDFEVWRNDAMSVKEPGDKPLFVAARLRRIDETSAELRMGLAGLTGTYRLGVSSFFYDREADYSVNGPERSNETALEAIGEFELLEFHSPTIVFPVSVSANAVEINLKADGIDTKLTLRLDPLKESYGTIKSVSKTKKNPPKVTGSIQK